MQLFMYCIWSLCVSKLLLNFFSTTLATSWHQSELMWYWCNITTGGDEGATGEIWKIIHSVKIVSVYLSFQNNKVKLMVSFKCYDNFDKVAILNLQRTA